ncbi:MAG: septum formation family protein [Micromonosporaceae bacterium]|nr:septum formation family protein [Micromonosporaceae bacterium]
MTVPLIVVALAAVGLFVVPRVLSDQQASPSSSATPSPSEDLLAVPQVGSCHVAFLSPYPFNETAEEAERVPCDEEHMIETIAVGELADSTAPPSESSNEARRLYRECEEAAQEFLGVAWRSTYTWLVLSVPSPTAWDQGAHWYRCDLTVNRGFYQTSPARTTGTLRGNAQPITCLTWFATETRLSNIEHSECNVAHQGELAGVFPVPEGTDYSDIDALTAQFEDRCLGVVRDFVGIRPIPNELSFWYVWPYETDLDQWVLCLVAANEANRAFTASLRGIGAGPIPFA